MGKFSSLIMEYLNFKYLYVCIYIYNNNKETGPKYVFEIDTKYTLIHY